MATEISKLEKTASVYSIIIGISMIGLWIMLISSSSVEEFDTRPIEIVLHITAEILTGVILIAGGAAMWKGMSLRYQIFFLSLGMLFYTSIVSPGYYADRGEWPIVIGFGAMLIAGIALASLLLLSKWKARDMEVMV